MSKIKSGVSVSGNIADKADGDGIVSIVKSSLGVSDVTDKQTIASGKPEGFDVVRRIVTNQVKRLEAGQGNIIGQSVSSGTDAFLTKQLRMILKVKLKTYFLLDTQGQQTSCILSQSLYLS